MSETDSSQMKLVQIDEMSFYYGQVVYLNEFNNIVRLEEEEDKSNLKMVRHGWGCQIHGINYDEDGIVHFDYKYEGNWLKDKRNGKGIAEYQDKSVYSGNFTMDKFEGKGKFTWPNGDSYEGEWINSRMEGFGIFHHHDGTKHEGLFNCNYFLTDRDIFINPFLPTKMNELILIKSSEYLNRVQYQESSKFSIKNILKIDDIEQLEFAIEQTIKNNKTPMIIRLAEYK